jgi:predicted phage-related endonuclease
MMQRDITAKINRYRMLQDREAQLRGEREAIRAQLMQEMDERQTDELRGGVLRATRKEVTSTRADTAALRRERPEIYARYSAASTSTRFEVV